MKGTDMKANEIVSKIVDQVLWSMKLGKIEAVSMDDVLDQAEMVLTTEEYDFAAMNRLFKEALWSI